MPLYLVVNPTASSGGAAARVAETIVAFREFGHRVVVHRPESASAAQRVMRRLAGEGAERIVVLGGDGLVHQAVNALAGSETILGIVSAGTGNDTATGLGLSHDFPEACQAANGPAAPVDLIETVDGLAATVATIGFSVEVNDRAERLRFPRGGARYTVSSLIELPTLDAHSLTMTLDGTSHEVEANLVAVANTPYFGGGMKIAPDADPTDGLLDVVVIGPAPRWKFAALLPTVFSGRHVKNRYVTVHRAAEVTLDGPDLAMRADGEPYGSIPASISVRRRALRVAGFSG